MVYTVTLNPAVDKTLTIPHFTAGAVNRVVDVRTDAGGKGINVSQVLHNLGIDSVALALAGGRGGRWIEEAVRAMGIETDFVYLPGETRVNTKIVDPENHTTTDVNEPGCPTEERAAEELLARLCTRVEAGDVVVLSGSLPAGLPADTYEKWVRACRNRGAKVLLDTSGEPLKRALAARPELIKPNDRELEELTGKKLPELKDICLAARELAEQGIGQVVVTLGAEGAVLAADHKILYAAGLKSEARTTVGAGDAVVAAFAAGRVQKMDDWDTLMLAIACGAAAVQQIGSAPAEAADIFALVDRVEVRKIVGPL